MAQTLQHGTAFAKTTRPVIGSAVRRVALFNRLDGRPGRTVAWIHGPPGAGKSTLAASYVEARNLQCVWYQIDADDADAATFFHYLRHAARRLDGHRGQDLPAYNDRTSADSASFARKFFRALFARAKKPAALVFDNLPEADTALLSALAAGFAEIPKHCCVVVTSRCAPPPSLARLQASGELVCVGGNELRFQAAELVEIGRMRGIPLDLQTAQKLEQRTQGWVAGIVLMLEHAKLAGKLADLPEDAAPKVVFDYLAGEIFARFEPATQRFLARIASLPRVSAEVAEILSGDKRARRLLRNLAHNDYFIREARSEEGLIYVIHPLLRDFLRAFHAEVEPAPQTAKRLKAAALHLHATGQSEDAVDLLAECKDWDGVAAIAAKEAPNLLAQGRGEALRHWVELLPKALLEDDARLLYASGLALLATSPRTAYKRLERAFEAFGSGADRKQMLACCSSILDALLAEFDDLSALDPWIERTLVLLNETDEGHEEQACAAALGSLLPAILARAPARLSHAPWLDRAARLGRRLADEGDTARRLSSACALAALLRGELGHARSGLEAFELEPRTRIADSVSVLIRAVAHLLDGEHRAALQVAQSGLEAAAGEGAGGFGFWLNAIAALGCLGLADTSGARARTETLESAGAAMRRGERALVHWLRSLLAIADDDRANAFRECKAALALAIETAVPWLEFLAQIELAQLLRAAGDRRAAEAALRSAAALAETLACPALTLTVGMTEAALAHAFGDSAAMQAALRGALALGRSHGLKHVAALAQSSVAALCALALRDGIDTGYARSLVRAGNLAPPPLALRLRQWPWRFQVRVLGDFALRRDDTAIEFSLKGPGRPVELLKVLVALGGQSVRTEQIADALWPRVDADYAHKSFTIALHRLRRMLEEDDALVLRDARLSLNRALFWVDSWALEALLNALEEELRDPSRPASAALLRHRDELIGLYPGPFLPDESDHAAFIACRDQTRARIARALTRVVRRAADPATLDSAEECYLRLIDADELCEAFHRGLMQLYLRSGDRVEALATFERLRNLLATRLGSAPSAETQAAYAQLAGAAES